MKKYFGAGIIIVVLGGIFYLVNRKEVAPPTVSPPGGQVACTMEAKLCPDGSYVGRTGPNCEFALCPTAPALGKNGVTGTVTLGPTCPVERIPPDPNCAPKFYSTSIAIYEAGHTDAAKIIESDGRGAFSAELDPGNYILEARGGNPLPRCEKVSVQVKSSQYANVNIACDTGIR